MDAIEIRPARPEDADTVAAYHERCFLRTYRDEVRAGTLTPVDRGHMRDQLRGWFRAGSGFETDVAVHDGVPIAHVTVNGAHLVHLFVAPEQQGTGLGGRLLARGEAAIAAGGHTHSELHTRVDNGNAISFYEHAGWTVTDRVIHTVEHDISYDERVLVKRLAG